MRSPESSIYVDAEGDWFHQGSKIIRPEILQFLVTNLQETPDGNFIVQWQGQKCSIEVADTPLIIVRVDRITSEETLTDYIKLGIKHLPFQEFLDPASLFVGEANVLYCRIMGGRFRARFSRPAYYQLATWIEEDKDSGLYYIELNGIKYFIPVRVKIS